MSGFRITGHVCRVFGKSDEELAALGALRYVVDEKPGFADRIEMRDPEIRETAILLNYVHMDKPSPYVRRTLYSCAKGRLRRTIV
jgi:hypothetical protein